MRAPKVRQQEAQRIPRVHMQGIFDPLRIKGFGPQPLKKFVPSLIMTIPMPNAAAAALTAAAVALHAEAAHAKSVLGVNGALDFGPLAGNQPGGEGTGKALGVNDTALPTFDTMGLREDLLRGIYAYGFEKPSAIQQRAIKPIVKRRDVIAQAQSGTGKTATFSIALLQSIDTTVRETQVLCLSPTRELAVQIQKVVLALGDYMNVQCHACIGGTNLGEDIRKLDYGQHVVSGTPGRVFDMIRRRTLRTW